MPGIVDSCQLSGDSDPAPLAPAFPAWTDYVLENSPLHPELTSAAVLDYTGELIVAIAAAAEATGVWPEAIVAVLDRESRLDHYGGKRADGALRVLRGDEGRAVGIGQIHTVPWERYYSYNREFPGGYRSVHLDRLADNVLVCAAILLRGGWRAGDDDAAQAAQRDAYAYYNSGERNDPPRAARLYAIDVLARCLALRAANEGGAGN